MTTASATEVVAISADKEAVAASVCIFVVAVVASV